MSTVYETMHVMNIPHGPWKSCRWWKEIKECTDKHWERNTHQYPLFQAMFPELQWEMQRHGRGHKLTAEPDTEEAQTQVWTWLKSAPFAHEKFSFVKFTTWWECFQRLKLNVSQHYSILYILCVLVHSQGHFKTIGDMPIWGRRSSARPCCRTPWRQRA